VAAEVAERYGVPFVCDVATSVKLTQQGFKWFVRPETNTRVYTMTDLPFVKYLENKTGLSLRRIALVSENTLFGLTVREVFLEDAPKYGFEVVLDLLYSSGAADLTTEVLKIKEADPDVLILAPYVADAILFFKTFDKVGYRPKVIIGRAGFDYPEFYNLGDIVEGVFMSCDGGYWSASKLKEIKEIDDAIMKLQGYHVAAGQLKQYAAFWFVVQILEKIGTLDPYRIIEAMKLAYYPKGSVPGVPYGIRLDDTGENTLMDSVLVQLIKGTYVCVWPVEYAETEPII
jgi:branched-chain amino acid transport system substrate-binding protein